MHKMFTLYCALTVLSVAPAHAKIKSFAIENLSLNFNQSDGGGLASAQSFNLTFDFGKLDFDRYIIDITKGPGHLLFTKSDTSFRLDGIDQSVLDAVSALSAERIDIKGQGNKSLNLSFKNGAISLGEEVHGLSQLELNCSTISRGDDTLVSFLIPCFDDGLLYIPEIQLSQKSAQTLLPLWLEALKYEDHKRPLRPFYIPKKIQDIELRIHEQKMELSLEARFIFKLKLKINGTAQLNQKKNIAVFDIQKARVGFINVHGLILSLLEKIDVTNIIVEGSKITIKI